MFGQPRIDMSKYVSIEKIGRILSMAGINIEQVVDDLLSSKGQEILEAQGRIDRAQTQIHDLENQVESDYLIIDEDMQDIDDLTTLK